MFRQILLLNAGFSQSLKSINSVRFDILRKYTLGTSRVINLDVNGSKNGHYSRGHSSRKSSKEFNCKGLHYLGFTALAAVGISDSGHYDNQTTQQSRPLTNQLNQNPANRSQTDSRFFVSWNEFCHEMLARGEVEKIIIAPGNPIVRIVLFDNAIFRGQRSYLKQYLLRVPSSDIFENKLREFEKSLGIPVGNEVPIVYERASALSPLISLAIVGILAYFFFKNTKISGPQNLFKSFTKAKFTLVDPTTRAADASSIKFKDVAGLKEAKVEVMEFVDYLKNSERFMKLGAKLPKGVLLLGPPGCGKTLLAKAVATEANVPFLALAGSDFVEMIGGVGASRVRSLFKSANKLAPCIIYIDEIDSIGKKRSGSQFYNSESEQTLNQLLVEMDGLIARKSVILLASTNRADVLDKALTRPGRFDRQILIDLPNLDERKEIFEKHASNIKLEKSSRELALRIAQLTPGMSGADIANVCNEAALHAARKDRTVVLSDDFEYAIERVVGGTEKRISSISANERRIIAYHESGHALVGWLLEHTDPILKVSIVPRTTNILGFAQYLPSDRKLYNRDQFFDQMCMALGGRVAELVKFKDISTGAQDDLKRVTKIAMAQIKEFGFDSVIGHVVFPEDSQEGLGRKPYSKHLANVIDKRASLLVRKAFEKTLKIMKDNTDKLNLLAEALIVKEVINSSDIEKLIGPPPFAKKQHLQLQPPSDPSSTTLT